MSDNDHNEAIREFIRKSYAGVAAQNAGGGCCGDGSGGGSGGCCSPVSLDDARALSLVTGYAESDLNNAPPEANMGLGCGNPTAVAGLKAGEVVLDLGSGGGIDCFLARMQVGDTGHVIGVDMTPEMIQLARQNAAKSGLTNIEFRLGEIEHLPVADASVDVIISNCVINLSLDKQQVFAEAYRVLKPGGRLAISDMVATRQLTPEIKQDLTLISCCVGGAEPVENIRAMLASAGFKDIKLTPEANSSELVAKWFPGRHLEDYVASYMIEARK